MNVLHFKICLILVSLISPTLADASFTIYNGTVRDNSTGLIWQQSTADLNNDGVITTDAYPTGDRATWEEALAYCEDLNITGQIDWRLGNIRELGSIIARAAYAPAIDTTVFQCESSSYWSSTTYMYSGNHGRAWVIGFGDGGQGWPVKTELSYVRCVRGGILGGAIGYDNFVFDTIPSPVAVATPIDITVRALDASGNPITDLSEPVWITSNASMIVNSRSTTNGVTTFNITFADDFASNQLHAQAGSIYGDSNFFDVGDLSSGAFATLQGNVVDSTGTSVTGATVTLTRSGSAPVQTLSGANGYMFNSIDGLVAGYYEITVDYNGLQYGPYPMRLGWGSNYGGILRVREAGKQPVILIPGFMGSDKKRGGGALFPKLPKKRPAKQSSLKIHDPGEIVDWGPGWDDLDDDLSAAGFEVYHCPWDWRYAPDAPEAQKYLEDVITKAKLKTGAAKVDIVAHSMGGLLARYYIQSKTSSSDVDVDRFAMVGTPNHGALLAYPGWEGGDPILADFIAGSEGPLHTLNYFYTQTLDKLYKKMRGGHILQTEGCQDTEYIHYTNTEPCLTRDLVDIRSFLHNDVEGLGSLLSTEYYCLRSGGACHPISADYQNNFLLDLNADSNIDRLTNGTVNTKIFASMAHAMVREVNVDTSDPVFQDGKPFRPFSKVAAPSDDAGDGTVLLDSALLPNVAKTTTLSGGKHSFLISEFRQNIIDFLTANRTLSSQATVKSFAAASTSSTGQQLQITVENGFAPLLTGPDNAKNGIDLETGADFTESTGVEILRDSEEASLSLPDPTAGTYSLKISGRLSSNTEITITYYSTAVQGEIEATLYIQQPSKTIQFVLDPTADQPLLFSPNQTQPQNLRAVDNTGNTSLIWDLPQNGTPVSYNVYSRLDYQTGFTLLATTSAPSLTLVTTDPYSTPRRLYAVTAVDAAGNESIFSRVVDNQPVIITTHEYTTPFPWHMFLPAIQAGAK